MFHSLTLSGLVSVPTKGNSTGIRLHTNAFELLLGTRLRNVSTRGATSGIVLSLPVYVQKNLQHEDKIMKTH